MYSIEILRGGQTLASASGAGEAALLYRGGYEAGDEIVFHAEGKRAIVQVDQQVNPARIYLPEGSFSYRLPLAGDGLAVYPPQAFSGEMHLHLHQAGQGERVPQSRRESGGSARRRGGISACDGER